MNVKAAAMLVAALVLMMACGQKPGVYSAGTLAGGLLPPGATVNEQGQIVDAQGNVIGSAGGVKSGSDGSLAAATGAAGASRPSGSTQAVNDPVQGASGQSATATDTGVTGTSITIGSHAPLTGAAPVPSSSAEKGSKLLWQWMKRQDESIYGRNVEAILKNDNYNPSQAVAVCKEMVEKDKVFLLAGLAGTDQIQACARYAASVGVPYISAGVTEQGLTGLYNYFTATMTYADQGPLLADMLATKLDAKGKKNGMLRFDTPNFQDAHDSFVSAMSKQGTKVVYDRAVSKGAGQTEAQAVVQEMSAQGIENVYVLTSPVWFLQVLKAADTQNYNPQWVGVGITMAFDTVARAGCPALNGARFFAPFPAWVDRNKFDPEYDKAMQAVYGGEGDDFVWLGWSASKAFRALLENTGKNLTREAFIAATEKARNVQTPAGPTLNFSPDDHFGADQVHVLEARCSDSRFHTIMSHVSDF